MWSRIEECIQNLVEKEKSNRTPSKVGKARHERSAEGSAQRCMPG